MEKLLVIDDDPSQLRLLARWCEHEGWQARTFGTGREALVALSETLADVVVLDLYLGDEDGLEILSTLVRRHPGMPVVMLTAETSIDVVVEAMQRGAYDYVTKPMRRTKLITTLKNALEKRQLVEQVKVLEREVSGGGFQGLIGESPAMKGLFRQLDRVAPSEITVLVQGESGTGKELVAQAIHQGSSRRDQPFVAINCAAIPESLQESELFGHEKGAFTGADARRAGRFEQANGGTLFLDEVGELTPALQAKLLRALQERRFYRVGGDKEIEVDVRIVAATHRDLEQAVHDGSFREDLFYRLAVYELALPPLRGRGEDVLLLARHLLARHPGGGSLTLRPDTEALLRSYDWPGNVRELDNAMARAAVVAERVVRPDDLPPRVRRPRPQETSELRPVEAMERHAIVAAIEGAGGNLSEAMRRLDIPRTSFYRKLKKYGIDT